MSMKQKVCRDSSILQYIIQRAAVYIRSYEFPQPNWGLLAKLKEDFKFDCSHSLLKAQGSTLFKGLNEGGCAKQRVEARGSLLAEVRRPRLVSGSRMNKASLISECRDASAALQA